MNNFFRNIILLICLLIICQSMSGQNDRITWGPELKDNGIIELVGEQGDYLYATQASMSFFKTKINFVKIDKSTLQIVESKRLDFSGYTTFFLDLSIVDNKFQLLLLKRGKQFYKIVYDLDLNELSNELIAKFEKNALPSEIFGGMKMLIPTDMVSSIRSPDKSKVTVMLTKAGKKRGGVELFTFDIEAGLKQLYHTDLRGTISGSKNVISDIEVLSDGKLNVLAKEYIDGKKERKDKKPNYRYSIYKVNLDGESKESKLPVQNTYWKNARLKSFESGSIIIAGMTQEKPKGKINGFQVIKCDSQNEVVFNNSLKIKLEKEKDRLDKTFYLKNIATFKEEEFILIAENAWIKSFTNANANGTMKDDEYYYENILLSSFDSKGDEKWMEWIYRSTKEKGGRELLSSPIVYSDSDQLSLFYNTSEKNTEIFNRKKQKTDKFPDKNAVVLGVDISDDGSLSFKNISQENKMHISTNTSFSTNGNIYFVGAQNNKLKKMYLGRLTQGD